MATLGKNQVFEIKNGDGTSFHNLVLRKSAVESVVMSLGDKISGDVYYKDNSLSVTMHEYITYNGVNYMLVNPPTIVREGIVSDNSELKGMTKYSFVFYHPMCQLANFPFSDVAVTSDETRYLSEGKTFSWIGKPADFVAKLNKNLTGTEWIVELSSRFPQDKLDELSDVIPFDNATIADACKTFYDVWGVPYVVDKVASTEASYAAGKRFKLVMGLPSNEIYENAAAEQQNTPFVFQMGHGVGLKNNSRTPRNNKIITRISGYGSENNIPYGYPQVRWYGTAGQAFTYGDHAGLYTDVTIDGVHLDKVISYPIYKGILDGEYVELIKHPFTRAHLMPSVYRTCLFNKISFLDDNGEFNTDYDPDITLVDYYDAVYSSQYPYPNTINLQAPSYESHEFEDEKPELREAHIISTTPLNNDLTPASSWDDSLDDEGNYKQSYFQMVLPQLSFDLYACASITEEMQINMRSGTCLGCTFTVQVDWDDYKRNFYDDEGNFAPNGSQRDLTKYPKSNQGSISLVLQKDNSTFGTLMPNMYQYPKGETSVGAGDGDMFVILGISLPESYIFAAEWRLDADMKSYMLENNVHYFDYPLKFDEDFLFHNENILSQIHPNTVVRFNYAGQIQSLFVKQITVKYGDQPLPQYDITLTDNVEVVLNQIGQVAEDVEKLSTLIAILRQSYGKNVWNELAKKLSKTQDDTAAGYITMLKGLQVGANFVPDILGEGGVLRMRDDGKVELVTDILYARVKAYFDSVEIREYQHTGGNRIASVAGNKICRVAWFNSSNVELEQAQANLASVAYFRCYFRASDGEDTVRNNWVIGDQAYCHITSVTTATDNPEQKGLNQKHLWRLVIGRNTDGTLTEDGEAYIDLSNRDTETISGNSYTGYQSGSDIPEAQDDIIQLGNVNDTTRQGAIVEFVTGTDAPSYQIYQGINSFSLNGKNQITIGYNTATGKADMKVYGDAYIGDRNRSTYIEYKQDDGTQQHAPVLNIKAKIQTLPNSTYEGKTASQFVQDNQLKYDTDIQNLTNITNDLQSQIDGEIVSWFYEGTPTLENAPAVDWNTDTLKERHLGDMYYDVGTGVTSGFAYRFIKSEQGVYAWQYIDDTAITLALAKAAEALGLAGSKAKTYTTANNVLPSAPYNVGDLWLNATGTWGSGANAVTWENEILKCINACPPDGTPDISDWAKASKYTDDSAFNGYINAFLNGSGASGDSATAAAIQKAIASALGSGVVVDGGLLLTSLIGMRQNTGTAEAPVYTTWAGISGQYDSNVLGGGMAAWYGGGMLDKETLTTQQIAQGWSTLRWAKGVDRFDGSGYRADGNISWNANGALTIKNITTLSDSNNNNILNELATFNSAFTFGTSGQGSTTALYITPQVPFESLYIGTSNANKQEVATKNWVNQNFVTTTFFDNLFRLYNGTESASNKIAVNGTLPSDTSNLNIEAMFGFWTKKYISALGQGDDGSTSYTTLAQLNDVSLSNPTANQILVYDGTHWRNQNQQSVYELPAATTTTLGGIKIGYSGTTAKTYAVVLDSGNKAYVSVPWENTWTAWAGATSTAAGTAGYMPAPTSAQRNQFLRGDGTWVSLNNYSLPTASADTLGGVKIGTTLAIASGVLNLPTTGVTAGTYKRVTVDAYGRVTSGDNTDIDTNTWRNIYVGGTSKVGTGIDTKAINFKAGSNVAISYVAAGTGSGQSGNANYFDVVISATDTTYSAATQSAAGLMSAADKKKLDGIAEGANNYSLPLAASGTRGGVQIGFTTDAANRNYAVQLSSEKMFVNVPWVNTWRGIQNNLTSDSTSDSLSAAQGKALKGYIDTLNGYFSNGVAKSAAKLTTVSKTAWGQTFWTSGGVPDSISGSLSSVTNITMSGYIKIGDAYLSYDSTNNAIRVSANANGTGAVNFYAVGGVSALGETADGQAGVGDVTWALLADGTDTRQIALSHLTTSLTTITGGTTDSTNKKYAVYKNSSNQLFVDVPWTAGSGTVTSVKVGTTSYTPTNGVISLPAYPTVPTKVSQLTNDSGYITSYTNTWRNIYVSGTEKLTTAITTKGLNFAAGSNVSLSFAAAGTGSGQSGNANFGTITISATDTTYESKAAASGGTAVSLVTTGEKYTWNNKTYTTSIATDSGTNQLTLAFGTKYKLTAGGTSYIFTMPANPNTNTTYSFATGDSNGQIKVTPSSGSAYNVSVKGLGSAAYLTADTSASNSTVAQRTANGYLFATYFNQSSGAETPTTSSSLMFANSDGYLRKSTLSNVRKILYPKITTAHFGGTGSTTKIKINITSTVTWMLCFTVTLYQGYRATKVMISGYQYGSSHWYQPEARILGDSDGTETISVYFGYDSTNNLWVGFDGGSYTGVAISDVVNGYTQIDNFEGLFTISNVSSLATLQTTVTAESRANYANNADTTDGLHVHSGRNNEANKIVRTDGSGYIQCGWINTTSGNFTGTPDRIWASNDAYMRYMTPANFFPTLANDSNQLSVTVGGQNRKLTIAYASSAGSVAWGNVSGRPTNVSSFTNDSGYVTSSGVTSVATGTGLTGGTITGTGTISINSTYQTYISHGETAYGWGNHANAGYAAGTTRNFTAGGSNWTVYAPYTTDVDLDSYYLRLSGGTMTGHIYLGGAQAESSTGNTSQIVFGTANTQYLALSSNTNRLILNPATNGTVGQACISVGSQAFASYLAMNSGGKLGVGTSSPSEKLHVLGNILADNGNGSFVQIGNIRLVYDSANNAIKVIHSNGGNANLYATGGVSALGAGQESGGGGGDVTWALLASPATGGRTIHSSYISSALSNYLPLSGGNMTGSIDSAYYSLAYSSTNPYLELKGAGITTYVQNYQGSMYIGFSASNSIKIDSDATLTTKNILVTDGSTGDSPYIEFRRGTNADDYTDWRIRDSGGDLSFYPKSLNSNWPKLAWLGGDGVWNGRGFSNTSDIRKKNVIKDVDLRLDQIAKAPAFEYYWFDQSIDHDLHVGTSAQYWESVLPQVVTTAKDEIGTKAMQYGVTALISAITVARKVMTHEEKIALLETRVSALEKENGEQEQLINSLQEELAKFKAA